jgi:hypothetical protein
MQDKKVMILGSEWIIREMKTDDKHKGELAGYSHMCKNIIVIDYNQDKDDIAHTQRHEIIHAFKFTSGLGVCEVQNDEQQVDWMATQLTKIYKVYKELKIL